MTESRRSWKQSLKTRPYEEHKHCVICARAVPLEQDFCSLECKEKYDQTDKKKGKKNTIQCVILVAAMVIMMVIVPLLSGGGA